MWRKRLPHWRAEDVTYYVTFRHRRALEDAERDVLFRSLLKYHGLKLEFAVLAVLPESTEMIFTVLGLNRGFEVEFSKFIEATKRKSGKKIIENSGERFSPFWEESFDRILRDEQEMQERFDLILEAPVNLELCEDPEEYDQLFVPGHS
jgi:hypothetical protein